MVGRPSGAGRRSPRSFGGASGGGDSPGSKGAIVPTTNTDPVWSLCPWPVDIELDRKTVVQIPATCAIDWLKFLLMPEPDFSGLIDELMPEVEEFFFSHELPVDDLYMKALEVIGIVSARSWWITIRLIHVALNSWPVTGPRLMFNGIDATKVSLAAWLDALVYILIENMDPKDVTMFSLQLEAPPPESVMTGIGSTQSEVRQRDPLEAMTTERSAFLAMAR